MIQSALLISLVLLNFLASSAFAAVPWMAERTRVLTPDGYVSVGKLKVGDLVFSWDFEGRCIVINEVSQIDRHSDKAYGDFFPETAHRTIATDADVSFYVPAKEKYIPIIEIGRFEKLLRVIGAENPCEERLVLRGEFTPAGLGQSVSLKVKHLPDNLLIEGFVAQAPSTSTHNLECPK